MGQSRPHVVIIGGGFAGLYAARSLRREPVRITLIDRRNHHLFQPLLYQVATAALDPSDIAYPIRAIFREQQNVEHVLLAAARSIDVDSRRVELDDGHVDYDTLIVATGATHSYFGHDDWASSAPGLKTIEDALDMRRRVLLAFERAERHPEEAERHLTFVVVGAGPTGVELAGALIEIAVHTLAGDFDAIDPSTARVILVEGADRVLPPYPEELSESARRQLESLGVEVMTGAIATAIDDRGVTLKDGTRLDASTVLWAAGVQASPLAQSLGAELDRAGRVKVDTDLSVPGHPEIFVLGDLASATSGGEPVPGVAPAAIQAGKHAARCVRADLEGKERPAFRYVDKGSLATIGRARAVADFGRLRFGGFAAWLAWMLIHVFFLIGFRNRVFVMLSWAWSYLTFRRGARLITGGMTATRSADGDEAASRRRA
jgi:NADH dehydrogenase